VPAGAVVLYLIQASEDFIGNRIVIGRLEGQFSLNTDKSLVGATKIGPMEISGQKWTKYSKADDSSNSPEVVYVLQGDNYYYLVSSSDTHDDLIIQILSTFKFTDSSSTVDTSTWKTYTNSKYEFAIKYPADWKVVRENEPVCDAEPPCIGDEAVTIQPNLTTQDYKLADEDYAINNGVWLSVLAYDGGCNRNSDWTINGESASTRTVRKASCFKNLSVEPELFQDTPNEQTYQKILDKKRKPRACPGLFKNLAGCPMTRSLDAAFADQSRLFVSTILAIEYVFGGFLTFRLRHQRENLALNLLSTQMPDAIVHDVLRLVVLRCSLDRLVDCVDMPDIPKSESTT